MPPATAPQSTKHSKADSNAGDAYALLNQTLAALQGDPSDQAARLMAIRNYLALHLVLPARELLESWPEQSANAQELRDLREILRKVRGDPLSWSQCRKQF